MGQRNWRISTVVQLDMFINEWSNQKKQALVDTGKMQHVRVAVSVRHHKQQQLVREFEKHDRGTALVFDIGLECVTTLKTARE